ncbi:hypothetical protein AAHH78_34940, partial [Burkholderia pseudomallei]
LTLRRPELRRRLAACAANGGGKFGTARYLASLAAFTGKLHAGLRVFRQIAANGFLSAHGHEQQRRQPSFSGITLSDEVPTRRENRG